MSESFGARLRRRREEQAISLAAIAQQTKIKESLLDALERDDMSRWPSGIFRRSFVKSYARAIGLDPDAAWREFLARHPDPVQTIEAAAAQPPSGTAPNDSGPPTRIREMMGTALGSLSRLRRAPVIPAMEEPPAPEPVLPVASLPPPAPDFMAVARLSTEFALVERAEDLPPLLKAAAAVLEATGLILWIWDEPADSLRPALAHGYSEKILAQLPMVPRNAENATAAAFRSARLCAIGGTPQASAALVVPLVTAGGCAGVLAIELKDEAEPSTFVRAAATILAALLAPLISRDARGDAAAPDEISLPAATRSSA